MKRRSLHSQGRRGKRKNIQTSAGARRSGRRRRSFTVENNWLRRRVLEKKNPSRPHICWGSLFCTNLTQPTGNLDSKSSREIMDILRKLHTEGRTVILITHDDKIAQSAKRIIRIMDGKIESDSGMADPKSMEEENGEK